MFRVVCILAACAAAYAQESINYATLSGRVIDQSGAAVPGAVVLVKNTETNLSNIAQTDRDGRFRFAVLKVGPYRVTIHHDGFGVFEQRIVLTVGSAFDVPVTLSVVSAATVDNVVAEASPVEAARSQVAGTISQTEVASLPLNGRNFLDLALLVPGVSPTNTASNQLFAETSAVPGQGISIGSQRNFSNSFIVDGLSANDDAAGLAGTFYGLDVVQEFQVVTSGGQAEFGRALGGYINMVTRGGTNSLHGDIYGYFRNQRLNAANPLSHTNLPLTQAQYGASAGGPLIAGRTFYFANFEQRRLNQSGLITIAPGDAAAIDARLAAVGYSGPAVATGLYPNPVHSTNFLGKVDHEINAKNRFSARYSVYDVNSENTRGAGALSAVSAAAALHDVDHTAAFGNVTALSSKTVNEVRGQFTSSGLQAPPNDAQGPAVAISGVASFGTLSTAPTARDNRLYEIADNFSHQFGPHAVRAGIDILYNDLTIAYPQSNRGSYSFASLAAFLSGAYNNAGFTQSFGEPVVAQTNPNAGVYVQDEWQAAPRLTLNLGLRYDVQKLQTIVTDTNNVSPRAGFAWSPCRSRHTVVRGSYGLFYDRVPLRALANALLSSGNTTLLTPATFVTVSLSPSQAGAPVFPNILSSAPAVSAVNFSTMNRHLQNAYSEQGSFEIEQQVSGRGTLAVGYEHVRGLHLVANINRNPPLCVAAGTNNGCRPDPAYANDKEYSAAGDSHYDALEVSFVQRPARWGSVRVAYTFSKAMDNVGEFFFSSPVDNFDIWRDYGRSDDDQRHRVTVDGSVHARGWQLSGSLQYYSPLPFNVVTGANTVQGTSARPLLAGGEMLGRNAGRGFDSFTMNARVSRTFRLGEHARMTALAEGFNVLNHRNDLFPNGTFGSGVYPANPRPGFGDATAVGDARTVQLALRVAF